MIFTRWLLTYNDDTFRITDITYIIHLASILGCVSIPASLSLYTDNKNL